MAFRVLVVTNLFPPHTIGGAEIVAYRQARALLARGHKVTVLSGTEPSQSKPEGFLDFEKYDELPVYRLSLRSLDPDQNFYWPAAARRLRSIIAADRIDITHLHNLLGIGANVIQATVEAGSRCFVTLHDHWGFCPRATRLRQDGTLCTNFEECSQCRHVLRPSRHVVLPSRLRRDYIAWCLAQADRLITPSDYMACAYRSAGFPADSITVISNGVDLDAIPFGAREPSREGIVRFLCSAHLGEHKGILVLLEALKLLSMDPAVASRWHMTIAGDGHLREKVKRTLRRAGLAANVSIPGRLSRSELLALLRGVDVVVLPSIWPENEPVTMLESIASGAAQIATGLGGTPELVDDEQSGLLVAPGDPSALAQAMKRYIQEPSLAAKHGAYNLARREQFDETQAIDQLETLYSSAPLPVSRRQLVGPIIICGTAGASPEATLLVDNAYKHLEYGPPVRFVWHDWADVTVWRDAKLLWLWDRHPAEDLTNMALRHGVPVLAPRSDWTEGLARHYGAVILYSTYIEALATMRALFMVPNLRTKLASLSRAGSRAATALAPDSAFHLSSEGSK